MITQTKDTYCTSCGGRYINNICPQCGKQNISAINSESQNNSFVSSPQKQTPSLNYNNQIPNNNIGYNINPQSPFQPNAQIQSYNTQLTTRKANPVSAVSIVFIIISVLLTIVIDVLAYKISSLNIDNQDLMKTRSANWETISKLNDDALKDFAKIKDQEETIDFYEKYFVITRENDKYYHTINCSNLVNLKYFYAYEKDEAVKKGYKPCPNCQK